MINRDECSSLYLNDHLSTKEKGVSTEQVKSICENTNCLNYIIKEGKENKKKQNMCKSNNVKKDKTKKKKKWNIANIEPIEIKETSEEDKMETREQKLDALKKIQKENNIFNSTMSHLNHQVEQWEKRTKCKFPLSMKGITKTLNFCKSTNLFTPTPREKKERKKKKWYIYFWDRPFIKKDSFLSKIFAFDKNETVTELMKEEITKEKFCAQVFADIQKEMVKTKRINKRLYRYLKKQFNNYTIFVNVLHKLKEDILKAGKESYYKTFCETRLHSDCEDNKKWFMRKNKHICELPSDDSHLKDSVKLLVPVNHSTYTTIPSFSFSQRNHDYFKKGEIQKNRNLSVPLKINTSKRSLFFPETNRKTNYELFKWEYNQKDNIQNSQHILKTDYVLRNLCKEKCNEEKYGETELKTPTKYYTEGLHFYETNGDLLYNRTPKWNSPYHGIMDHWEATPWNTICCASCTRSLTSKNVFKKIEMNNISDSWKNISTTTDVLNKKINNQNVENEENEENEEFFDACSYRTNYNTQEPYTVLGRYSDQSWMNLPMKFQNLDETKVSSYETSLYSNEIMKNKNITNSGIYESNRNDLHNVEKQTSDTRDPIKISDIGNDLDTCIRQEHRESSKMGTDIIKTPSSENHYIPSIYENSLYCTNANPNISSNISNNRSIHSEEQFSKAISNNVTNENIQGAYIRNEPGILNRAEIHMCDTQEHTYSDKLFDENNGKFYNKEEYTENLQQKISQISPSNKNISNENSKMYIQSDKKESMMNQCNPYVMDMNKTMGLLRQSGAITNRTDVHSEYQMNLHSNNISMGNTNNNCQFSYQAQNIEKIYSSNVKRKNLLQLLYDDEPLSPCTEAPMEQTNNLFYTGIIQETQGSFYISNSNPVSDTEEPGFSAKNILDEIYSNDIPKEKNTEESKGTIRRKRKLKIKQENNKNDSTEFKEILEESFSNKNNYQTTQVYCVKTEGAQDNMKSNEKMKTCCKTTMLANDTIVDLTKEDTENENGSYHDNNIPNIGIHSKYIKKSKSTLDQLKEMNEYLKSIKYKTILKDLSDQKDQQSTTEQMKLQNNEISTATTNITTNTTTANYMKQGTKVKREEGDLGEEENYEEEYGEILGPEMYQIDSFDPNIKNYDINNSMNEDDFQIPKEMKRPIINWYPGFDIPIGTTGRAILRKALHQKRIRDIEKCDKLLVEHGLRPTTRSTFGDMKISELYLAAHLLEVWDVAEYQCLRTCVKSGYKLEWIYQLKQQGTRITTKALREIKDQYLTMNKELSHFTKRKKQPKKNGSKDKMGDDVEVDTRNDDIEYYTFLSSLKNKVNNEKCEEIDGREGSDGRFDFCTGELDSKFDVNSLEDLNDITVKANVENILKGESGNNDIFSSNVDSIKNGVYANYNMQIINDENSYYSQKDLLTSQIYDEDTGKGNKQKKKYSKKKKEDVNYYEEKNKNKVDKEKQQEDTKIQPYGTESNLMNCSNYPSNIHPSNFTNHSMGNIDARNEECMNNSMRMRNTTLINQNYIYQNNMYMIPMNQNGSMNHVRNNHPYNMYNTYTLIDGNVPPMMNIGINMGTRIDRDSYTNQFYEHNMNLHSNEKGVYECSNERNPMNTNVYNGMIPSSSYNLKTYYPTNYDTNAQAYAINETFVYNQTMGIGNENTLNKNIMNTQRMHPISQITDNFNPHDREKITNIRGNNEMNYNLNFNNNPNVYSNMYHCTELPNNTSSDVQQINPNEKSTNLIDKMESEQNMRNNTHTQ